MTLLKYILFYIFTLNLYYFDIYASVLKYFYVYLMIICYNLVYLIFNHLRWTSCTIVNFM